MESEIYDSYWLHEALTALESHGVKRPVIDGLFRDHAGDGQAGAETPIKSLELAVLTLRLALERKALGGPGRGKTMPINLIARGAVAALMAFQDAEVAPSADLVFLIARLMKVDGFMRSSSHAVQSEEDAILLICLIPDITASELADEVETTRPTASRWLKNPRIRESASCLKVHVAEAILSKAEADDIRSRIEERRRLTRRGRPRKGVKIRPRKK